MRQFTDAEVESIRSQPPWPERVVDERHEHCTRITVEGPISWSYQWPNGNTAHLLKRAEQALLLLSPRDAPYGIYDITVDGVTARVLREPQPTA